MFITPNWNPPSCVKAFMTTRVDGVSTGVFGDHTGKKGLNPALHVGDDLTCVQKNRELIHCHLPSKAFWLNQTHGTLVYEPDLTPYNPNLPPEADAVILSKEGQVGVIMTADCLPLLLASADGSVIGAAHAGWRGLLDGVIEKTVMAMCNRTTVDATSLHVWLGAAIGPLAFEIGSEVRQLFVSKYGSDVEGCFKQNLMDSTKWFADIYSLARFCLRTLGVSNISGGDECTVMDAKRFYSYRRDGQTGRMASFIWRDCSVISVDKK